MSFVGMMKRTCLVERGQSWSAKSHFQRMPCSFRCLIFHQNLLVYFPSSFGIHHSPNPTEPNRIVGNCAMYELPQHYWHFQVWCFPTASSLSAYSPGRSWCPYHIQLSLSQLDFLLRITGYDRGEKKEKEKKLSHEDSAILSQTIEQFTLESPKRKMKPWSPTFQKSSATSKASNPSFPWTAAPVAQLTKPDCLLASTATDCKNVHRQVHSSSKYFQQ